MNAPAGDSHLAARVDLGWPVWLRPGQARKRKRLRHRLGVLELVLDDHPHDESALEQRIAVVERQFREEPEHGFREPPLRRRVRLAATGSAAVRARRVRDRTSRRGRRTPTTVRFVRRRVARATAPRSSRCGRDPRRAATAAARPAPRAGRRRAAPGASACGRARARERPQSSNGDTELRQAVEDERRDHRALADGRSDALRRAMPHVTRREEPDAAGLEREGIPIERPAIGQCRRRADPGR